MPFDIFVSNKPMARNLALISMLRALRLRGLGQVIANSRLGGGSSGVLSSFRVVYILGAWGTHSRQRAPRAHRVLPARAPSNLHAKTFRLTRRAGVCVPKSRGGSQRSSRTFSVASSLLSVGACVAPRTTRRGSIGTVCQRSCYPCAPLLGKRQAGTPRSTRTSPPSRC
jgi:hypothetical protein